jgi:phytoene desaturase
VHVVVIGAGFGGIAAALRMRAKGYAVTLIDRCNNLGGRAQIYEKDGFRHDAGPTVITAPFLLEELFSLFHERMSDHITLIPLTPWYRFIYSDGDHFDYGGSIEDTLAEVSRIAPNDVEGYRKLLNHSKRLFDVGFTQLSARPFHSFLLLLRQIPVFIKLQAYKTVWQFVSSYLKSDKLKRAFSIQPLLVGGNPFDTTCIYNLIHYLERSFGVFFAKGGTGQIVTALESLMRRHGIHITLGQTVTELEILDNHICGIRLDDGTHVKADIVVSNVDAPFLYTAMMPRAKLPLMTRTKIATAQYSMGLFVLYFGTSRTYDDVAHHTIILGDSYEDLLNDIFHHKKLNDDFSLYLHRPTATDKSFAPKGCDSFYVLCPVPNMQANIDWQVEGPRLRDKIIACLSKTQLPDLEMYIVSSFYKTPEDFKDNYNSVYGAGFSIAPLFRQSAWFRFHNKAEGVNNLYLVGASTHPGAGLPGVLTSAKVLDSLVPRCT